MGLEKSGNHSETKVFLRNASEPGPDHHEERLYRSDPTAETDAFTRLKKNNPGDNTPPEGVDDTVMAQIKQWKAFCVLAVQLDDTGTTDPAEPFITCLETTLSDTAKQHQGIWFKWRAPLYALVLPAIATEQAHSEAKTLQKRIAEEHKQTVTIGIAAYPLLSFNHGQSLINACKAIDHAVFFGPGSCVVFDSVSLNISGDHFYQTGETDSAMDEYKQALALDPNNVNVHNSLGVCHAKKDNLESARQSFQTALLKNNKESMALHNLGMIHLLEKNTEKALERFKQAYKIDQNTFEIPYHIGKLLSDKKQWNDAKRYLEKAAALGGDNSSVFSMLGKCLLMLKKVPEAAEAYKKAVKLNPNDAASLSALGTLYAKLGENPDICLTFCRQSVSLAPDKGIYHKRLARLHHKYDQLEQALTAYEKAAELGQDCQRYINDIRDCMAAGDKKKRCA